MNLKIFLNANNHILNNIINLGLLELLKVKLNIGKKYHEFYEIIKI